MGHGAIPAEVDATIVFIRERSPAARCASESLVAKAIVRSVTSLRAKQLWRTSAPWPDRDAIEAVRSRR